MNNSDSDFKFAIGFIVGIAAGLAIGLILTPRSGIENRELLREKLTDAGDTIREIADDVRGVVREFTGNRSKIYRESCKQPRVKPYTKEL